MTLDSAAWQETRTGWSDKFTPRPKTDWDSYPAVNNIFSWQSPGVKPNKTWVYAPSKDVLENRWQELSLEQNSGRREEYFRETRDSSLYKGKKSLPGTDTEQNTDKALAEVFSTGVSFKLPKTVHVGYRPFDRQYVLTDSRFLATPRPDLWAARIPEQIFVIEQHSRFPGSGPGLYFSSLIPDMNHFKGAHGGRTHPLYHPNGQPNLVSGVLDALSEKLGENLEAEDVLYYLAGITGHPAYVQTFEEELQEAGIRVPLTSDGVLWNRAVELGKYIVWLQTFGERGVALPGLKSIRNSPSEYAVPIYQKSMGEMPEDKPKWYSSYLYGEKEYENALVLGDAIWSGVEQEVFDYTVGGNNVLGAWAGYRLKNPNGKRTSPLNDIVQTKWPREWSVELTEILAVLTHLVHLEPEQKKLLTAVMDSELISLNDLQEAGVQFPKTARERKPKLA